MSLLVNIHIFLPVFFLPNLDKGVFYRVFQCWIIFYKCCTGVGQKGIPAGVLGTICCDLSRLLTGKQGMQWI